MTKLIEDLFYGLANSDEDVVCDKSLFGDSSMLVQTEEPITPQKIYSYMNKFMAFHNKNGDSVFIRASSIVGMQEELPFV